jgi:hypothetical protein
MMQFTRMFSPTSWPAMLFVSEMTPAWRRRSRLTGERPQAVPLATFTITRPVAA